MGDGKKKRVTPDKRSEEAAGRILSTEAFSYYRGLIGQIEIALPRQSSRVLLVSSSIAGEGTTETVVGLGLTLAVVLGRKTAIVDCNSHHPDLHTRFGTPKEGLNEYLQGEIPIERALVNTTVPNLHVMPLGENFDTLTSYDEGDLEKFVTALREKFDYVLVDSAPVGVNPESVALCDKVDAVVLVVKHGKTRREVVMRTREIIERAGGKLLGVVFNKRTFPIPDFVYRRL
ncbi:MAG: CpsD/CapB family tyrosine-protein kinase [Candidatus Eisenbacteria bacterium]